MTEAPPMSPRLADAILRHCLYELSREYGKGTIAKKVAFGAYLTAKKDGHDRDAAKEISREVMQEAKHYLMTEGEELADLLDEEEAA